jgi:hypothetical protein
MEQMLRLAPSDRLLTQSMAALAAEPALGRAPATLAPKQAEMVASIAPSLRQAVPPLLVQMQLPTKAAAAAAVLTPQPKPA